MDACSSLLSVLASVLARTQTQSPLCTNTRKPTQTGKRGPLTQQLQLLYAALVEADVAAGRDAAWDDDE